MKQPHLHPHPSYHHHHHQHPPCLPYPNLQVAQAPPSQRPRVASGDAQFDGLLSALLGWVLALLPTFRPRQTATCMYALGRLELNSPEV